MPQAHTETATMKNWEAAGWTIRPYHFSVIEIPPPADYRTLKTPAAGDIRLISDLPDADYTLLQPIPVRLEQDKEGEWIACFEEANISMPGTEPEDACQALADEIVAAFEIFLEEEETLGPEPARQLAILRRFLQPLA